MLTQHPAPTPAQLARIDELEKEAKDALRRQEESWERSDTDGFLSQWANGMTASLNRRKIELLKTGEHAQFPVLVHKETGKVLATKLYRFPVPQAPWTHSTKWRIADEDMHLTNGRRWIPFGLKSRVQKQFGLTEEDRWFPAVAEIMGSGTGLSGCANAYVGVRRRNDVS